MSSKHIAGSILLFLIIISCNQKKTESPIYSFFTAGHTYGNPNSTQYGLYPPFTDFFDEINNHPNMKFGVLTGDVVPHNTIAYWDSAQADVAQLNIPIHIAAGNHDIGTEFEKRFEKYYFSFTHKKDLFIILTPGLDEWNISGEQLEFLKNKLDGNSSKVNNIFIFLHELIWWSPDNEFRDVKINYEPHYPGSTNFESIVKPLLLSYPNNITVYAGDLGATSRVSSVMYHQFDNITLIGSGMGGGKKDNFIITNVYKDHVQHELISINGKDSNKMGKLIDYHNQ